MRQHTEGRHENFRFHVFGARYPAKQSLGVIRQGAGADAQAGADVSQIRPNDAIRRSAAHRVTSAAAAGKEQFSTARRNGRV